MEEWRRIKKSDIKALLPEGFQWDVAHVDRVRMWPGGHALISSLLLLDDIGSDSGKSMTEPPGRWISWRIPTFGSCGACAKGNGDSSMMLTSSLTGCRVLSMVMFSTTGDSVEEAGVKCWGVMGNV
uniref:Uncharacterized protein n=1 Tax=Romanomermis culicivorax TaxID=13658 RepID=A0A915JEJ5_ROMCU